MDEMEQAENWVAAQDRFFDEEGLWSSEVDTLDPWDVFGDDWEGDERTDLEHASEWLASAGWGTDEDYGLYTDPWE